MNPQHTQDQSWTVRPARAADAPSLARLASLDSQAPLRGDVVVTEIDGEIWAAVEVATGRTVADPFRASRPAAEAATLRTRQRLRGPGRTLRPRRPAPA